MTPQSQIAHYRITAKLGEGGMGEVWRATDTKLNRDVALKILPEAFANDRDRMARFEREAQVLASLNHPNIAAIYGVEERAIVMELVEGKTLAGPLAAQECMPIIDQLIDALEYAHEKGIVHRDLKPDNIKLTLGGRVKVLDFGLAKAMVGELPAGDPAASPTLTMRSTLAGVIMGTAGYMSPEQARGQEVDKRADIWAFGVIVYELLTGQRLFEGPTVSDTIAAVLTREPDLQALPPRFRRLLLRCLTRDPRQRLRDISGAHLLLEDTLAPSALPRSSMLPWAVAAVLAAVAGAGWWMASRPEPVRPVMHLEIGVGEATPLRNDNSGSIMAISPDGTRLVFVLQRGESTSLYTRLLSQPQLGEISGSADGRNPFFSPDGKWIGFTANGKLKKIPVSGGGAITLCDAPNLRGASWSESGEIIAALNITGPLSRIPSAGGTPVVFTTLQANDRSHRWPQALPGGRAVIFSANAAPNSYDQDEIAVYSFDTGKRTTVYRGGFFGRYLPGGFLTWVHGTTVFAARFDLQTLAVRGDAVAMLEDVRRSGNIGADLEFSPTGTLLYHTGGALRVGLQWIEESGNTTPLPGPNEVYYQPRLSPDASASPTRSPPVPRRIYG